MGRSRKVERIDALGNIIQQLDLEEMITRLQRHPKDIKCRDRWSGSLPLHLAAMEGGPGENSPTAILAELIRRYPQALWVKK